MKIILDKGKIIYYIRGMKLSEKIRILRQAQHLSRNDLAVKMGGKASRQLIQMWERGATKPNYDNLARLIQATGIEVGYFFEGID